MSAPQITTIMGLVRPLQPRQRTIFLEMLVARLDGRGEPGDGQLYRLCRDLQRQLYSPPVELRGRPRLDDEEERPRRRAG